MRVLVTAVGGDIGYGIGKILRDSGIAEFSVGCDIHGDHPGELFFSKCEIVPRANVDGYLEALSRIARAHRIDLIIPASEPELRLLYSNGVLSDIDGIPLMVANKKALHVGFDKLETAGFLRENGLLHPWTVSTDTGPPLSLPCVFKERFGAGGRGVEIVTQANSPLLSNAPAGGIWQELLEPDDEEYTCGVYRSSGGEVRSIVIKRKLVAGSTRFGVVCRDRPEIESLLDSVAVHLNLRGSVNAQLRLTKKGPTIFEINPRFSSTLVFRHLLGFQDVIWSILERSGQSLPFYEAPAGGTAFFKGTDEIILPLNRTR